MATPTYLARDRHNNPIQALKPRSDAQTHIVTLAPPGSARMATALQPNTVVVRIYANVDVFAAVGPVDSVVASAVGSMPLPATLPEYIRVSASTSLAVAFAAAVSGLAYVTEMS